MATFVNNVCFCKVGETGTKLQIKTVFDYENMQLETMRGCITMRGSIYTGQIGKHGLDFLESPF